MITNIKVSLKLKLHTSKTYYNKHPKLANSQTSTYSTPKEKPSDKTPSDYSNSNKPKVLLYL
jgi:hypothetical protein